MCNTYNDTLCAGLRPSSPPDLSPPHTSPRPGGKRKREAANGSSTEGVTGKGSSDAYYLVYVRRGTDFPPDSALKPPADVMVRLRSKRKWSSMHANWLKHLVLQ